MATEALHARLMEQRKLALAEYPQYDDFHDPSDWGLVSFRRDMTTKGGLRFTADEVALAKPSERDPGHFDAWSVKGTIHVLVPERYVTVVSMPEATTEKHFKEFDADPVVGEVVSGRSYGPGYSTRWSGTYQGVVTSEWDGEPMHFLTDGIIGTTPQSCFGHPAPGEALTTDLSPSQIMADLAAEATR